MDVDVDKDEDMLKNMNNRREQRRKWWLVGLLVLETFIA